MTMQRHVPGEAVQRAVLRQAVQYVSHHDWLVACHNVHVEMSL